MSYTGMDKFGININRRAVIGGAFALACPNVIAAQEEKILEFALPQTDSRKDFLLEFSKLYRVKIRYNYYTNFDNLVVQIYKNEINVDVILSNAFEASIMFRHKKLNQVPKAQVKQLKTMLDSAPTANLIAGNIFDEAKEYTFVIGHTYAAMIYNKNKFKTPPKSIDELFPKSAIDYNLAWTSNGKHVVRLASKLLGYGFNNVYKKSLDIVRASLINSVKYVNKFSDGMNDDLLANNFADVGMSYTSSALARQVEITNMGIALPNNGLVIGEAVLTTPTIARNQLAINALFEFLATPVINKAMVESAYIASPYPEVLKLTSQTYQNNPLIFPKNVNKNLDEFYLDLGDDINKYVWDIWKQAIKTRVG